MKTTKNLTMRLGFAVGLLTAMLVAQETGNPDKKPADRNAEPERNDAKIADQQPAPSPAKGPTQEQPTATAGEKGLRLNFRGVPLEMVLNYLSDAAGFIIDMETSVKGNVDVWSNQPLNKDEAIELLNTVLNQNGYAAIRNDRILKIVDRKVAKQRNIPVVPTIPTNGPAAMPISDEMVTQIIPIRYANATQMIKDLQQLLPDYATLTANESANALVLTDTQSDARRMVEIVRALDTSISSISAVRVFPLKFADAKDLATAVKDLFTPPAQQNNNNNNPAARFFARFGGGGPFGPGGGPGGGAGGGGADQSGTGTSEARTAASRVVSVADERSNSLVVSAPDEFMPTIEQLVNELDVSVNDVTELRVFHLKNADPAELADQFSQLFPDESKTANDANQNQAFRFFRGGAGGGGANNRNNQTETSDRMKKKSRVIAVSDSRTSSLIVSAAGDLMPQIAEMIAQLHSSSQRKQRVAVIPVENADPQQIQQVLQDMFQRNTTTMNRNNANQNSALMNRSQNNNQATGTGAAGGNTGLGNNRNQGNPGF